MFITRLSNAITVDTFIQLTSISGGRLEPPTVFAVRLDFYYNTPVDICQLFCAWLSFSVVMRFSCFSYYVCSFKGVRP